MNITRVERDGVEFFTIDATGESGMSEAGLARLCCVSRQAVMKVLRETGVTKHDENLPVCSVLYGNAAGPECHCPNAH